MEKIPHASGDFFSATKKEFFNRIGHKQPLVKSKIIGNTLFLFQSIPNLSIFMLAAIRLTATLIAG
jgi:hypothetical protein